MILKDLEEVGVGDEGPVFGPGKIPYCQPGPAFTVAVIIVEAKSVPAIGVTIDGSVARADVASLCFNNERTALVYHVDSIFIDEWAGG